MVVCLVPAAPVLLPRLTGSCVPEVGPVRAAVRQALTELTDLDRVVVVAAKSPGTLAGFGAATASAGARAPARPGAGRPEPDRHQSWPGELADELLDEVLPQAEVGPATTTVRQHVAWEQVAADLVPELDRAPDRVGLLLLADGSRTRGPRAPGGQDPRGEVVDAELVLALQQGRAADVPDAAAVGATAAQAVRLLAGAPGGPTALLHQDAPLGVCYLVAVRRRQTDERDGRT